MKIGLVLLGSEILFNELIIAGPKAIAQALAVVFVIWYVAYFVARKLGLDKEFSAVLASGVSICGVSAAIATGGAIKADPKKVSHVIGLILFTSIIMLFSMPPLAKFLGFTGVLAGAWIGGTIDTTPAVVAAGALYSSEALKIAAVTKMAQSVQKCSQHLTTSSTTNSYKACI
ncbi:MAG: YeiH family protein [Thermoprotei archaeon]